MNNTTEEPLLIKNPNRFTLFPIKHSDIWKAHKIAEAALWTADEIDFSSDLDDWEKLDDDERFFIENILAFFAGSDGIVLENLMSCFSTEIQYPEARAFYALQSYIETVHSEVYSLMIETFVRDIKRKEVLLNAIEQIPCVSKKADWAMKWMDKDKNPLAQRIVGFIIVEGLFFSGSFCSIYWLKSKNKMKSALAKSNELIARDENMHTNFGILLYKNHIVNKCPEQTIHEMFREAIDIELDFICNSLPCRLIGMNHELMSNYVMFIADRLISLIGYNKIFHKTNPFPFMENIGSDGKTNFFEERVTEYQRSYAVSNLSERKNISLNDDF